MLTTRLVDSRSTACQERCGDGGCDLSYELSEVAHSHDLVRLLLDPRTDSVHTAFALFCLSSRFSHTGEGCQDTDPYEEASTNPHRSTPHKV